ncbi:MAG: glycosyltransferase family 25 protein [Hyphomicrobiales bacterium]|nr:MAG: glycosyltransferase family 25 protein [Hyphomicrobiales bacterium]
MQIYYLNMARDADRRVFMEQQFSRLGLAATRIEAVARDDLTDADRADILRIDAAGSKLWAFCVTLSHIRAMRALLGTNAPHALIFEDDAVLSSRLPAFLAAYDAAPPALDLLRIETSFHQLRLKPPETALDGYNICRPYSFEGGRAGYIVTRLAAEIISSSREVRRLPHDKAMFDPYEPLPRRLRVRQLSPALVAQAQYVARGDEPRFVGAPRQPPTPREMGLHGWLQFAARAVRRDTTVAVQKAWHQYVGGAKKQRVPFLAE